MTGFVTPYLIRVLCENTFEGGRGYTPNEVGDMTLDQFLLCLLDKKYLSKGNIQKMSVSGAHSIAKEGKVKVRTAQGDVIEVSLSKGKSVVARLAEASQSKDKKKKKRKR